MRRIFPYGLDAPPVVALFAGISALCWLIAICGTPSWLGIRITGLQWPGLATGLGALAMIWDSAVGKLRARETLLDLLPWTGGERVLDVGCGLGLLAIAAARRVPAGHVDAIDLWRARDLSGNGPDAVLANARREGVADRLTITTMDMRMLAFPDRTFDTIVSRYAIHNIAGARERARAVGEIARVLAPGGSVLIEDIAHAGAYAATLRAHGLSVEVRRSVANRIWAVLSFGGVRGFRLRAR